MYVANYWGFFFVSHIPLLKINQFINVEADQNEIRDFRTGYIEFFYLKKNLIYYT